MNSAIKKIAIIDIGTNSIKFCVAQTLENGEITFIKDTVHITRLGEQFKKSGLISANAFEKNLIKIIELKHESQKLGVDKIIAVGTMALRYAKNSNDFIQCVKEKCNIEIQILSGYDEARLSYLAAISSLNFVNGCNIVFDSGGGSTEFTFGKGDRIKKKVSLNLGALLITEQFFKNDPVKPEQLDQVKKFIIDHLRKIDMSSPYNNLIGIGGAVTTMAAVKHKMVTYSPEIIQGTILRKQDIYNQIDMFSSKSILQRKKIPGLQNGREGIILAGACIVYGILELFRKDQLTVCDRGLRHALIRY
ncbi:exopolyphosphatase [Candidatus Magnetomorum sp. HK-1]|nr:exopolyphosphatase [Candidatus Magnetomorum sp. HK-1]